MLSSIRMKLGFVAMLLAVMAALGPSADAQLPSGVWQYQWGDDFSGASVDTSKWNIASPGWTMPNSLSTATASKVKVGDGVLTMDATRTGTSGSVQFESGSVSTYQKHTFNGAYIEARILLPDTPGSWPAFWGLYDGWPPEMDIMEYPLNTAAGGGYTQEEYHTAFHYTNSSGGNSSGAGKVNPGGVGDLSGSYHTFGVNWVEDSSVTFYFDGQQVSSFNNATAVAQMANMYLILDYAVGGWPGTPNTTEWPVGFTDQTKVDWVRIWKQEAAKTSDWAYSGASEYVQWDTSGNWTNGVPNLGGVTSSFDTVNAAEQRIDWSGRRTLSEISLDGDTRYRLGFTNDRLVMGFGNGGALKPTINVASTTSTEHEVLATLEFAGGLDVNNDSAYPLLLSGPVMGGGGSVRISGAGPVTFGGANSYTADTYVGVGQGPGVAIARGAHSFGVGGTVVIGEAGNSTTARLELENNSHVSNSIALRGRHTETAAIVNNSGDNTISGTLNVEFGGDVYAIRSDAGELTLSGSAQQAGGVALAAGTGMGARTVILDGAGDGDIDGAIQNGSGSTLAITKTGAGGWTLGGVNTYSGATDVSQGKLVVNGTTGFGATTVASGAVLGGRGLVRAGLAAQPGSVVRVGDESPAVQTEFLIDDFSGDLSAYSNTRILDANGGGGNVYAWQNSGAALAISTTNYDGIEQTALTRTDYTLDAGQEIRADYAASDLDSQDIGLYVGAGAPTQDVRADFVNIYMRNDGVLYSRGFNGASEFPLVSGGAVDPDSLFIARTGANSFELGYYTDGVRTVVTTRTVSNTDIGDAIGFCSDVRGVGVRGSLDNLWLIDPDSTLILSETLSVDGSFSLSSGATLELDIHDATTYDRLDVDGAWSADGALHVALSEDAPALAANDSFDLLDFVTMSGIFEDVHLPELAAGLRWDTSQLLTSGVLTVEAGMVGDFNDDGGVDAADYTVWRDTLGAAGGGLAADANNDLRVDALDYAVWKSNYGLSLSQLASSRAAAVPEPSAVVLLMLGLAPLAGRGRRAERRQKTIRQSSAIALACVVLASLVPSAQALTFSVNGSWPDQARRDAAVDAAASAIDRYNAYGNFNNIQSHVDIYYDAGIPTAQASFGGDIGFGGTYPAERVMMHEMAHFLGLPDWNGWNGTGGGMMAGGVWRGSIANQLVQQFDGDGAGIHGDGYHFWPYGLNYDSEGSEINKQRQVAIVYAMRADLGIGPTAHPSTATTVSLTADDAYGVSGFNHKDRWSDGYFAHAGADYSTGDYTLRTPAGASSFTFAGDSLTVNNADGVDGGLLFKGQGTSGVTTINNLVLDGGYVRHASGAGDLFHIDGSVTLLGAPVIDAAQGDIRISAPMDGAGSLSLKGGASRVVTLSSSSNIYAGPTAVQGITLDLRGSTGYGSTTVYGDAALVGDGQVRGGLMAESGATVRVGGLGLPTDLPSGQKLIDDFASYPTGQIGAAPNTTGDAWTGVFDGTANAEIVNNSRNRALKVRGINAGSDSWRGAVTDLSGAYAEDFSLADGETGTYFFRVRRNGAGSIDAILGLSDLGASAAPGTDTDSPWNEYAVMLSILGDADSSMLRAYSEGSGDVNVASVDNAEWINVWLTVDNDNKDYLVATSTGDDDGSDSGSVYEFGRRTAGTVGASRLGTFGVYEARNVGAELDDLYFAEGLNLTNPFTQTPTLIGETLTIGGNLNLQAGSTLAIDVAGSAHDVVDVAGSAALDGVLSVTLDSSYTPALNDSFTVLTAASVTHDLTLSGPGGSLFSLAASTSTEIVLTAVSGLEGDYNNDGLVDAADYTVWRDSLGSPAGALFNDFQGVAVGQSQYLAWRENYGLQMSSLAENATTIVPEPSGAGLACVALVILPAVLRRVYRRRFAG